MKRLLGLVIVVVVGGCGAPERAPDDDLGMCPTPGWCWLDPTPQGNGLRASWGSARDDVWMVGDNGTLLHYDGTAWSFAIGATHADLTGVWGGATDDVWAWGPSSLEHWDGAAWTARTPPAGGELLTVWRPPGSKLLWASTTTGVFHGDGTSWGYTIAPQPAVQFAGGDAADVWAVGLGVAGGAHPVAMHWDGVTWSEVATTNPPDRLVLDGEATVWFAGSNGSELVLERMTPAGGDATLDLHVDGNALGMLAFPPDGFFIATTRGKLVHAMHGDGLAISDLPLDGRSAFWGADAMDLWVGGARGGLAHYASPDANVVGDWSVVAEAATAPVFGAVTGHAADDLWRVDPQVGVSHFDGHTWTPVPLAELAPFDPVVSLAPFRDHEMIATTTATVQWFDGTAWHVVRHMGVGFSPHGALATHGNDVWVAGMDATVAHWDGDTWTTIQAKAWSGIAAAAANDAWFASPEGVAHYDGQTVTHVDGLGLDAPVAIGARSPGHALVAFADRIVPIDDGVVGDVLPAVITGITLMQVRGPNEVWFGAQDGTVAHFDGTDISSEWSGTRNLQSLFPIPHAFRVLAFGMLDADPNDDGSPTGAILAHDGK